MKLLAERNFGSCLSRVPGEYMPLADVISFRTANLFNSVPPELSDYIYDYRVPPLQDKFLFGPRRYNFVNCLVEDEGTILAFVSDHMQIDAAERLSSQSDRYIPDVYRYVFVIEDNWATVITQSGIAIAQGELEKYSVSFDMSSIDDLVTTVDQITPQHARMLQQINKAVDQFSLSMLSEKKTNSTLFTPYGFFKPYSERCMDQTKADLGLKRFVFPGLVCVNTAGKIYNVGCHIAEDGKHAFVINEWVQGKHDMQIGRAAFMELDADANLTAIRTRGVTAPLYMGTINHTWSRSQALKECVGQLGNPLANGLVEISKIRGASFDAGKLMAGLSTIDQRKPAAQNR